MTPTIDSAPQSPALVLKRWNSWVQVYLPDSGETRWVDLGATAFQRMDGPPNGSDERSLRN